MGWRRNARSRCPTIHTPWLTHRTSSPTLSLSRGVASATRRSSFSTMCARASHDPAGTHSGRHSFRGCAASHSPSLRRPRCGSRDVNRAVTRAIDVRGRADAGWCFEWAGFASAPLSPLALFARLVLCCSFLVLSSALRPWHPALTPSLSLRSRRAARVPRALPAHPAVPARHHRVVPRAGACFCVCFRVLAHFGMR